MPPITFNIDNLIQTYQSLQALNLKDSDAISIKDGSVQKMQTGFKERLFGLSNGHLTETIALSAYLRKSMASSIGLRATDAAFDKTIGRTYASKGRVTVASFKAFLSEAAKSEANAALKSLCGQGEMQKAGNGLRASFMEVKEGLASLDSDVWYPLTG